jgi:hypothetical protein
MIPDRPADSPDPPGFPSNDPEPEAPPASQVHFVLELPPGSRVQITVEALPASGEGEPGQAGVLLIPPGPGQEKPADPAEKLEPSADGGARSEAKPVASSERPSGPVPVIRVEAGAGAALILQPAPVEAAVSEAALSGAPLSEAALSEAALSGAPRSPAAASPGRAFGKQVRDAWAKARLQPAALAGALFGLSLVIYLITHLVGLVEFPIYFFSDEAVQTVLAADLVRDGFRDYDQVLLPTYFKNGTQYNLSASVYLQVLPYLLFGKSIFVTRAVSVLVSLLAAAGVGLILRDFFRLPYWWAGTLLLSLSPAWFLHSRTAFETVLMVSFYTAALYCYLLYRCRSPRYLYACLVFAALSFYSYSPGQVVVALTGLALLLVDARYHWQNRAVVLRGALLSILLALPYLRFRLLLPEALAQHLRNLSSYWVQPLPLGEKLAKFGSEYLFGLHPGYWFLPNERDLPRHRLGPYPHLLLFTLPLALVGLVRVIKNLRSPAHRLALIAALAAPAGSALALIGITRVLVFIIPAVLFTTLGLDGALVWLEQALPRLGRLHRPPVSAGGPSPGLEEAIASQEDGQGELAAPRPLYPAFALVVFVFLALANFWLLRTALAEGPTWHRDYGMGGMQYGARQMFAAVENYLELHPGDPVIVTSTWANGADVVARFFFADPLPFQMGSVVGHLTRRLPLTPATLFVMTPEEFELARSSGKFMNFEVEKTLPYPDGRPGFYFVHLDYVEDIDAILAAESAARRALLSGQIEWMDQDVQVNHSPLDMGEIANAFDGDRETVIRTAEANPLVLEMHFQRPVLVKGLYLKFGSAQVKAALTLQPPEGGEPIRANAQFIGSVSQPDGVLSLEEPALAESLRLELQDPHQDEAGHIHLWEIELR